jgi:hypothetical protein
VDLEGLVSFLFPNRKREEDNFFSQAVGLFYRAYFRSLEVTVPKMVISFHCLSSFPSVTTSIDLISLIKELCLCPLTERLRTEGLRSWMLPLKGGARRFLTQFILVGGKRSLIFCNTALQLKRVVPKVPGSFIEQALRKHQNAISGVSRQSQNFIFGICREATKILQRCGGLANYQFPYKEQILDLSCRATIENPGNRGGGYGYYMETTDSPSAQERPVVRHFVVSDGGVSTFLARIPPTHEQALSEFEEVLQTNNLERRVVAITEPCKVRVITIHHASEANMWGHFQKATAKKLKLLPEVTSGKSECDAFGNWFDLKTEDFNEMRRVKREIEQSYGDCFIISDDASAATDSISPELSARVGALRWSSQQDPRAFEAFMASWAGAEVEYPALNFDFVKQTNSQLMGDRRSFPILCIIHLAAKNLFFEQIKFPKRLRFIRLNGDDGVILLPRLFIEHYFSFMNELWEINRMKTYVHPTLFSFNSQLWNINTGGRVSLLRFNIVDALDKFGEQSRDPTVWNAVLGDCPEWAARKMWSYFIGNPHWRTLLGGRGGGNWFLPHVAGGWGLRKPPGLEIFFSPRQKFNLVKIFESKEIDEKVRTKSAPSKRVRWSHEPLMIRGGISVLGDKRNSSPNVTVDILKPRNWLNEDGRHLIPGKLRAGCVFRDTTLEEEWVWSSRPNLLSFSEGFNSPHSEESSGLDSETGASIEHCESCLHPTNEFKTNQEVDF